VRSLGELTPLWRAEDALFQQTGQQLLIRSFLARLGQYLVFFRCAAGAAGQQDVAFLIRFDPDDAVLGILLPRLYMPVSRFYHFCRPAVSREHDEFVARDGTNRCLGGGVFTLSKNV